MKSQTYKDKDSLAGFLKNAIARESEEAPKSSVEYRALIEWREGLPYLVSQPERLSVSPTEALTALLKKVLDLPYDGATDSYRGLTNGEAMAVSIVRKAAEGDKDSVTIILDRIMGKPKQSIESVQLTGNLTDFLDKLAEQEEVRTTIEVDASQMVEDL